MANEILKLYEPLQLLRVDNTLPNGIHTIRISPRAESVMVSTYVENSDGNVTVELYDSGAASEVDGQSRFVLKTLGPFTTGAKSRDIVGKIHHHLRVDVTVSGTFANVGLLVSASNAVQTESIDAGSSILKTQILEAPDLDEQYFYSDFGTKNQRIVQIKYTAPATVPGVTLFRDLTYSLVGMKYMREHTIWSIV